MENKKVYIPIRQDIINKMSEKPYKLITELTLWDILKRDWNNLINYLKFE